jgi:hypothetical protein
MRLAAAHSGSRMCAHQRQQDACHTVHGALALAQRVKLVCARGGRACIRSPCQRQPRSRQPLTRG